MSLLDDIAKWMKTHSSLEPTARLLDSAGETVNSTQPLVRKAFPVGTALADTVKPAADEWMKEPGAKLALTTFGAPPLPEHLGDLARGLREPLNLATLVAGGTVPHGPAERINHARDVNATRDYGHAPGDPWEPAATMEDPWRKSWGYNHPSNANPATYSRNADATYWKSVAETAEELAQTQRGPRIGIAAPDRSAWLDYLKRHPPRDNMNPGSPLAVLNPPDAGTPPPTVRQQPTGNRDWSVEDFPEAPPAANDAHPDDDGHRHWLAHLKRKKKVK